MVFYLVLIIDIAEQKKSKSSKSKVYFCNHAINVAVAIAFFIKKKTNNKTIREKQ